MENEEYVNVSFPGAYLRVKRVQPVGNKCSFAASGTYGHECGATAVKVAVKKSEQALDGLYHAPRCAECATIKGGENAGVLRFESLNGQVNRY